MPKTPKIPLGLKGLNADTPAHALSLEFFSQGKNMRPFNGALNGVNSFADESTISFDVSGESSAPVGIYDAAQFTPAGSNFFNIIALVKHADGVFRVKAYSSDSTIANEQVIVQDKTITCNGLATVTADAQLIQETSGATATIRYDVTKGTDIRIYNINGTFNTTNDLEIKYPPIASATAADLFVVDANNANTSTRLKPNSIADHTTTGVTVGYDSKYSSDMFVFNECLVLNGATHKPLYLSSQGAQMAVVDNWPGDVTVPTATGDVIEFLASPKIAIFGGRLVALGLFGIKTDNTSGTYNEKATIIFSSPITQLASFSGVEWLVASTNTTVDDTITESPGAIIDGGQLGDNFIVYKSDIILSYREITSSPYILGRVIQTDDGMISSRCFADIGNNRHIVFGNYGVFIHNGDHQKQIVSKGKINDTLYAELNYNRIGQCFVFRHEEDKESWFCIPTIDHTGDGCNKAYCYAEDTDSWYTRDLDNFTHIFSTELNGITKVFACKPTSTSLQELSGTAVIEDGYAIFKNNSLDDTSITKTLTAIYPHVAGNIDVAFLSVDKITDETFSNADLPITGISHASVTGSLYSADTDGSNGYTNLNIGGLNHNVANRGVDTSIYFGGLSDANRISNVTANYTGTYPNHTIAPEIAFYLKNHGLKNDTTYYFRDFKYGDYTTEISAPLILNRTDQFAITAPSDFNSAGCFEEPACISQGVDISYGAGHTSGQLGYAAPFTTTIHVVGFSYNRTNPHPAFTSSPSYYTGYAHETDPNRDFIRGQQAAYFTSPHTSEAQTNLSNGIAVTANNNPVARKLMFNLPYDAYAAANRLYTNGTDAPYSGLIYNQPILNYEHYPFLRISIAGKDYAGNTISESLLGPRIKGTSYVQLLRTQSNMTPAYQQPIVYSYHYYSQVTSIEFRPIDWNPPTTNVVGQQFGYGSTNPYKFIFNNALQVGWAGAFMAVRKDSTSIPALATNDTVIPYIENHTTRTYNPNVDHKMDFRKTGRYFDMKVKVPSTTDPKLTGMEFEVKPRGKR